MVPGFRIAAPAGHTSTNAGGDAIRRRQQLIEMNGVMCNVVDRNIGRGISAKTTTYVNLLNKKRTDSQPSGKRGQVPSQHRHPRRQR